VEDWWSRDEPRPSDPGLKLAALTQLRALTLRQTWHGPAELRAKELPPTLEDLTLVMDRAGHVAAAWEPPRLVAFDRLRNLRRITFVEYRSWSIWRRRESRRQPTPLPHSLEVCALRPPGSPSLLCLFVLAPQPVETLTACWHLCTK